MTPYSRSSAPSVGVWGHPAVYGGQGGWVYVLESARGRLPARALSYGVDAQGVPQLTSAGTSTGTFGYTSGSPMVTSNGTTAGSAVVWVVYSNGPSGANGQLRAYGAIPSDGVLPLLWSAPIGTAVEVLGAHRLERSHPGRAPGAGDSSSSARRRRRR